MSLPNDHSRESRKSLRKYKHYRDSGIACANYPLIASSVVRINRKPRISLRRLGIAKHVTTLYTFDINIVHEHDSIIQSAIRFYDFR